MVATTDSWDNNYGREPLRFYMPDEICFTATGPEDETGHARHLRVRDAHNARLAALVQNANSPHELVRALAPQALHRDLMPSGETFAFLQAKAQHSADVLQSAPVTPDASHTHARSHWVHLPVSYPNAAPLTLHCFTIGDANDQTHPIETRTRRVRDLTLLYNLLFRQEGITARAVPNWLATASADCPSPGSAPVWAVPPGVAHAPGYWSFAFPQENVAAVVERGRTTPSHIVVAVLDTSPTAAAVEAAAHDPRHAGNLLLRHLAASPQVTIDRPLPAPLPDLAHLDGERANWRDRGTDHAGNPLPDETFRMDDHGLFVTGIIHDIAPHAEVHLIRALTGYGVTDYHTVIGALAQLPQLLGDDDTKRLIVNMSLGFSIPPGVEALRLLMQSVYAGLEAEFGPDLTLDIALAKLQKDNPATHMALVEMLEDLHTGLREIVDWLTAHPQVLMVAAAGNDNRFFGPRTMRPEPRWPARYDNVLGVAAVNRARQPADYSNRGDVRIIGNGVATFGGDVTHTGDGDLGAIDLTVTPVDAIAGIYSSEALTLGTGPNETGWVYWSGTSFSTPVITALAANLWDMRLADPTLPDYGPPQLIEEIVNTFFTDPRDTADPDSLNTPIIATAQEWRTKWR